METGSLLVFFRNCQEGGLIEKPAHKSDAGGFSIIIKTVGQYYGRVSG